MQKIREKRMCVLMGLLSTRVYVPIGCFYYSHFNEILKYNAQVFTLLCKSFEFPVL